MTFEEFISDILCIVVLYKKQITECVSINSLIASLNKCNMDFLVYDNSPSFNASVPETINDCRIYYIGDHSNSGVSKAYNTGAEYARKTGKKWLLLSDQDTLFNDNALYNYYLSVLEFPDNSLFVPVLRSDGLIISPCRYYLKNGFLFKKEFYGLTTIRNKNVLNSGICISLKAFEETGGYNENVPLYFSDFNFIDRFRKKYKTFVIVKTTAIHGFSLLSLDRESGKRFFMHYCIGARSLVNKPMEFILMMMNVLYRMSLLIVRFKTGKFVSIFYYHFILNRNMNKIM